MCGLVGPQFLFWNHFIIFSIYQLICEACLSLLSLLNRVQPWYQPLFLNLIYMYVQLLGDILLDRSNSAVMTRYVSSRDNLRILMNLLRVRPCDSYFFMNCSKFLISASPLLFSRVSCLTLDPVIITDGKLDHSFQWPIGNVLMHLVLVFIRSKIFIDRKLCKIVNSRPCRSRARAYS